MNRITNADIEKLNGRDAGSVVSVAFSYANLTIEFERIRLIGCNSKLGFRIDGDETLLFDDNRRLPALGWLLEARVLEFRRDLDDLGDEVLVIAFKGGNEIMMWVDDLEHECIVVELERNKDGIQIMIF